MRHPLLLIALLCLALPRLAAAADDRPNFLFIYTDDQRWDAMSVVQKEMGQAGRFPWLKTPNHDRLASQGMRFRNAFVVNSLCSPSRATFLTGRYSHLNGVANNHTPFPADSVTWATELRKAGYTTGYFGKWHMGPQSGQRPGFDYSASFVGQGKYHDCPIEVNGNATPSKGWVEDVTTDYALDWIRQNKGKPFAAAIGFKASHGPWDPPERHKDALADAVSRPPENADARPPYVGDRAAPARPRAANRRPASRPSDAVATGDNRTAMQRNYFRTLLGVDDNLGRLLDLLDELKLADNTVVVFTSDNGYYLGEHGLGDKRSAYEESLRIPFLVRYPKLVKAGSVRDEMVLNIDVAPTFLDLAGAAIPEQMQGRTLRPLLEGKEDVDWRKAWFYEYFYERNFSQPTILAVRTETHKLIKYPGHDDWTELYDLKADPYEKTNLYNDPAAADLRKQMEAEFEKQAKAVDFRIPDYADEKAAPAAKAVPTPPGPVLTYNFAAGGKGDVRDESKHKNDGVLRGPTRAIGRDDNMAMKFDGKGFIDVPKAPSQNPANTPWSVEVTFNAEKPDGVLVAHGGKSNGYVLMVQEGRPVFVVVAGSKTSRVEAAESVTGRWTTVKAQITADQKLKLTIDGKPAGQAKQHAMIATEPNDGMQIGDDQKSPVVEGASPFTGLIESVKLTAGE